LLDVDNGIFDRDPRVAALAESIVDECLAVAKTQRIELARDRLLDQLMAISRASTGQAISTLQDIRRGRPTEIASLNIANADYGDKARPPVRAERTRMLGRLIELKAELRRAAIPAST
jgi:2-dehydropantoate 2-reductase